MAAVDEYVQRLRSPNLTWKTMEIGCEEQLEGAAGDTIDDLRGFPPGEGGGFTAIGDALSAARECAARAGYTALLKRALEECPRPARQQPAKPVGRGGRRHRIGVSRRLRLRLSVAEERVKADRAPSTQNAMLKAETGRYFD